MTKEKLIRYGKDYLRDLTTACCEISDIHKEFVSEAIKALEQEPCADAVSRELKIGDEIYIRANVNEIRKDYIICENAGGYFGTVREEIKSSVTPTHKKEKWIKEYDNSALDGLYHCSVCGRKLWIHNEESVSDYPYCHCGAEMKGV